MDGWSNDNDTEIRLVVRHHPTVTALASARCAICSAELSDAAERFCGGDRCLRVFWPRAWLRSVSSHRGFCAPFIGRRT
jgi:hypothetical protein